MKLYNIIILLFALKCAHFAAILDPIEGSPNNETNNTKLENVSNEDKNITIINSENKTNINSPNDETNDSAKPENGLNENQSIVEKKDREESNLDKQASLVADENKTDKKSASELTKKDDLVNDKDNAEANAELIHKDNSSEGKEVEYAAEENSSENTSDTSKPRETHDISAQQDCLYGFDKYNDNCYSLSSFDLVPSSSNRPVFKDLSQFLIKKDAMENACDPLNKYKELDIHVARLESIDELTYLNSLFNIVESALYDHSKNKKYLAQIFNNKTNSYECVMLSVLTIKNKLNIQASLNDGEKCDDSEAYYICKYLSKNKKTTEKPITLETVKLFLAQSKQNNNDSVIPVSILAKDEELSSTVSTTVSTTASLKDENDIITTSRTPLKQQTASSSSTTVSCLFINSIFIIFSIYFVNSLF